MGIVWGLINPDMFQGVADTLEDIMQVRVEGRKKSLDTYTDVKIGLCSRNHRKCLF